MRAYSVYAIALSSMVFLSSGALTAHAQNSTTLDQINVETGQNPESSKHDGTILEDPLIGAPGVVISKQDLDLIYPTDIKHVFINETSVSVGGSTPVSQKLYVYGLEDSQLSVTIDGARQSSSTFHHTGTLLLDPSLLKAARVDAIVAPADAGPGALAGAAHFETVDVKDLLLPGKNFGGFVTTAYDTNSKTFSSAASAYAQARGFEILGYYKFYDGDDWKDGSGIVQDATSANMKSSLGKFAYEAKSGDRFEFSHQWVNDNSLRPYRANFGAVIRPGVTYPNQPYDLERHTYSFTYTDETPTKFWDPKIVVAYSSTRLDTFPDYGSYADIATWSGKMQNKFTITSGDIVAGVDFFNATSDGGDPTTNGIERDKNLGAYVQARLKPMSRTRVSLGGRLDHQMFTGLDGTDIDNTGFSGNVSGEFDLTKIITLKAGYAHVFGRIPLAEALLNYTPYTYDDVEPFSSNNFTAGISAKYQGFTFDANYVLLKMDDSIAYYAERGTTTRNNTADIESKGFDLAVGYKWSSGFIKAKYSNIEVTQDGDPIGTTAFYWGTNLGELITLQAAHNFVGTGLTIGADMQIALEQKDVIEGGDQSLPAYEVVNVFAQYVPRRLPNVTLRVEVNNIFDETYADRATSGQEYGTIVPLREPGRSVFLSAKTKF